MCPKPRICAMNTTAPTIGIASFVAWKCDCHWCYSFINGIVLMSILYRWHLLLVFSVIFYIVEPHLLTREYEIQIWPYCARNVHAVFLEIMFSVSSYFVRVTTNGKKNIIFLRKLCLVGVMFTWCFLLMPTYIIFWKCHD